MRIAAILETKAEDKLKDAESSAKSPSLADIASYTEKDSRELDKLMAGALGSTWTNNYSPPPRPKQEPPSDPKTAALKAARQVASQLVNNKAAAAVAKEAAASSSAASNKKE